jgi:hypothetical protein
MNSTGKIVQLVNPTNNQDAATKSYVDTSIPIGGIIMWSGTTGTSLPSNWKLCDGSTYNSIKTPDLRGRFVLSSGQGSGGLTNRTVDATGGVEAVTLTVAQMPSHNHNGSTTSTNENDNGTHTHTVTETSTGGNTVTGALGGSSAGNYGYFSLGGNYYTTMGTASDHTHSVKVNSTNSAHNHKISSQGGDSSHENMPPFYVLAFIMRIS